MTLAKAHANWSIEKGSAYFDHNGVVYHEIVPQSRTVNKKYYIEVMR